MRYRVVRRVDLGYGDSGPSCVVRRVVWGQDSPTLDSDLNTEYEEHTAVLAEARTVPEIIADRLFWGDYLSLPGGRSLSVRQSGSFWDWRLWDGSETIILPLEGAARLIANELQSSGLRVTLEEVRVALVDFVDEWPPHEFPPHPELVEDFALEDVLHVLNA